MVKKVKRNPPPEKKTYLGLRLLFVIVWFTLVVLLSNSVLLSDLFKQSNTDIDNLIIAIILLAPVAVVIFPVMYRIGNIYNISEKKTTTPAWKRYIVSLLATGILLGMLFYLFTIITFALFYRF